MCISFEASVVAFIVGQIFGVLTYKLGTSWSKTIGGFICFYSLVQLLEAIIYKSNNVFWSKILVANLVLQGVVFYGLVKYFNLDFSPRVDLGLIICVIIAVICLLSINKINTKSKVCQNGITWTFKNNNIFKVWLPLMYLIIIIPGLLSSEKEIRQVVIIYILTYIISKVKFGDKSPSAWCWSSAIVAPIIYFLLKNNLNAKNIN